MTATSGEVRLEVRRWIAAGPAVLFAAWTDPERLVQWWGPEGATCASAEIDLRVGGRYLIENVFADGRTVFITGEFEVIAAPRTLAFTWRIGPGPSPAERVTVHFEPQGDGTEVVVVHERILDEKTREGHLSGWAACLDGLARYAARTKPRG